MMIGKKHVSILECGQRLVVSTYQTGIGQDLADSFWETTKE
jgi:hypothetical protein